MAAPRTRAAWIATALAQGVGATLVWHLRLSATGAARTLLGSAAVLLWLLAAVLALSAVGAPSIAARLHAGWTTAARAVGVAITFAMFTVLFAVFLPLFLFVRLRDPLRKRLGAASYWEHREPGDDSMDGMSRPY
ncbi:MAG: hypothetical protein ACM3NQ_18045 [Bacteroidales bacterium]